MAYNEEKLTKLKALKQLAESVKAGFATKEELNSSINTKLSSTYKAGGSAAFADLPELTEANLGLVVNVTDSFTATESFVEGEGMYYPAGTNVAVVKSGEEYKYDVLAGFVDLSGYVEKEEGKGLSSNDFTADEKAKLSNMENIITNAVTTVDDSFAHRYGVQFADNETTARVAVGVNGMSTVFNITANTSMQAVVEMLNRQSNSRGLTVARDTTSGELVITDSDGSPVDFTVRQGEDNDGPVLSYTPGERFGPVFSFHGRSGIVVPQAGDYTPEMIGLSVASDEDVTEMLAEVFGEAE